MGRIGRCQVICGRPVPSVHLDQRSQPASSGVHVSQAGVYDSIPELYEDAQKYRDLLEVIPWDEKSLLKLIANRIRYSVPELRNASDLDAWTAVFAETLKYRQNKSFKLIEPNTDDPEFFIRKAIGWALRDVARVDPAWVRTFVEQHELSPLSRREALKHVT